MPKGGIYWDTSEIDRGLRGLMPSVDDAMSALMKYESHKVEGYMRQNAPWSDRTTNARNGLFARAFSSDHSHAIVCYHTMPYGIWLEVRWSGRYAIINPTIQAEGRRIMGDIRELLSRLRAT